MVFGFNSSIFRSVIGGLSLCMLGIYQNIVAIREIYNTSPSYYNEYINSVISDTFAQHRILFFQGSNVFQGRLFKFVISGNIINTLINRSLSCIFYICFVVHLVLVYFALNESFYNVQVAKFKSTRGYFDLRDRMVSYKQTLEIYKQTLESSKQQREDFKRFIEIKNIGLEHLEQVEEKLKRIGEESKDVEYKLKKVENDLKRLDETFRGKKD